jgi:hypothetical protein
MVENAVAGLDSFRHTFVISRHRDEALRGGLSLLVWRRYEDLPPAGFEPADRDRVDIDAVEITARRYQHHRVSRTRAASPARFSAWASTASERDMSPEPTGPVIPRGPLSSTESD